MKKKFVKPTILIVLIILVTFLVREFDLARFFDKTVIEELVSSMGVYAPLGFMGLYFIATVTFLPGTPLSLAGGFLFGNILGTLYIVIGATLGASAAFGIARSLGKDFVDRILKDKFKKLNQYDAKLSENGFVTMLFLRLVPLFPFNGLNFALGLTRIKFRDFFLGTLIGIIPGSFVLSNIGHTAADIRSPQFYLWIGLFVLLALVPTLYKKFVKNEKN